MRCERRHWFRSRDGLRLFARDFGPEDSRLTPVLCLAGLTRNSRDFLPLVGRLENERRLICPDYRGRGQSDYSEDPSTYHPMHELSDVLALLDHLSLASAAVVGTSRGGIILMHMAQKTPERVSGAVLNDIGPHIEKAGLARIARQLRAIPDPRDWDEAVDLLRQTNVGFETLSPEQWHDFARRIFRDEGGRPRADYDPNLARAFPAEEELANKGLPDLWETFVALRSIPTAVLRGEHSDFLSADTVNRMKELHPALISATVAGRGHVPFLDEPESLAAIRAVLSRCDRERQER
jgi:pimeloyl-ACP methyl ester carboxylesterase